MLVLEAGANPQVICRESGQPHPDCGLHNMLVVGEQTMFLSHLPMFHAEHRFQVILEASFRKDGQGMDKLYTQHRQSHPGTKMYTFSPGELFILPTLFTTAAPPPRQTFPGTVYHGHFERDGTEIEGLTGVDVQVQRVVYARELAPTEKKAEKLGYILFGKGQEFFLAHQITQAPDFDQIVAVRIEGHRFTDEELARGVMIMVPNRENAAAQRIKEGETVTGQGHITGSHQFLDLRMQATREVYFEEGELLKPPTFKSTEEERKAGF
jgi:hypothetical protein